MAPAIMPNHDTQVMLINLHHIVISYIIKLNMTKTIPHLMHMHPAKPNQTPLIGSYKILFYVASKVSKQTEATNVHHQV